MSNYPSPRTDTDDDDFLLSATPTPHGTLTNLNPRSFSQGSQPPQWSPVDTPAHHHQGTSYFPAPVSPPRQGPPPILIRNSSAHSTQRIAPRSNSISSSHASRYRDDNDDPDNDNYGQESDNDQRGSTHTATARRRGKVAQRDAQSPDDDDSGEGDDSSGNANQNDDDPITLKERQSMINVQHPFGLPIWKPALYKKSRSVTRHADEALHSIPSAQAERHLLPGNIFWVFAFGWWLACACFLVAAVLYIVPYGGNRYATLVFGLGWYLAWPFGKYVEGDLAVSEEEETDDEDEEGSAADNEESSSSRRWSGGGSEGTETIRGVHVSESPATTRETSTASRAPPVQHGPTVSWQPDITQGETTALLTHHREMRIPIPVKSYGATPLPASPPLSTASSSFTVIKESIASDAFGRACFWLFLVSIIAPLMLLVCMVCWALVFTVPMAKLNWALIKHLFEHPTSIRFCAAPPVVVVTAGGNEERTPGAVEEGTPVPAQFSVKHPRLSEGQLAPSGSPTSTVLLCVYRAVGWQYYKYTVGGVNILFVNLLPLVFFVIFDGFVLMPMAEKLEHSGKHVPAFLAALTSHGLIFFLSLLSVIPLSYFIGMAVASISAQSSIGMGAVINATFGSIIEIILYSIALTQGKGHLVEGSIVGSLLAGVLLMPGMSMCSGAVRRKELKFNAKSAGVTSMMLIMAIIGAIAPTLFYQTYGNFQLICSGCPERTPSMGTPWICDHCYYKHPDPVDDPFYQSTVKTLMYYCAAILLFSYLIGLWFSLRTHASQIWQNPQQLLHLLDLTREHRFSLYPRSGPSTAARPASLHRKRSHAYDHASTTSSRAHTPAPTRDSGASQGPISPGSSSRPPQSLSPVFPRRVSYATGTAYAPVMESVNQAVKSTAGLQNMQLPEPLTTDDFTRAVAVATVSALRHQQTHSGRARASAAVESDGHGHGGHDAPSWSRTTSASVLLTCTALYAVIAELLVDVVDVVLKGSGIDEKFLGVTLFALVPNTTEFMNAISFALNGNIALSMEIGSAYALQVCLLQIPAMVAFSAWYNSKNMGEVASTFTLIFPRWDVIALVLSMFLMTYTYIEAKSNYHRGSILIMSYLVLTAGFYFAPPSAIDVDQGHEKDLMNLQEFPALTFLQSIRMYLQSFL